MEAEKIVGKKKQETNREKEHEEEGVAEQSSDRGRKVLKP